MKKLLIGLIAVGVLLIAAILIAPSFVDWNAHKQERTAASIGTSPPSKSKCRPSSKVPMSPEADFPST